MTDSPEIAVAFNNGQRSKAKRLGDMQAFQARIAEKIAGAQTAKTQTSSLLAVQVGSYGVHIPLVDISNLLACPDISPVPLAKQWLNGLAVVRGEVLTVLDLAYCLNAYIHTQAPDLALSNKQRNRLQGEKAIEQMKILVINPLIHSQVAVLVDKVLGIVAANTLVEHAFDNSECAAVIKRASVDTNGLIFVELSLTELFKAPAFAALSY